ISFATEPLPNAPAGKWSWIGSLSLSGEGAPMVILANAREVHIGDASYPFPGGPSAVAPASEGIMALDFNYDFNTDLVLAGAGGVRLLKQDSPDKFVDVTTQAK